MNRHRPSSPAPPQAPAERGSADVGIVVAVGDVAVGQTVYAALKSLSENVALVSTATEALREIALLRPALLVVDDELPLVRGLDLAGRVRSERSDVEIILMTDDEAAVSLIGRLRVERVRCIPKPVDLEKLRQAVGVSSRALGAERTESAYDDLAAELLDQKARFERRIKNLERKSDSTMPPPRMPVEERAPPRASALPEDLRVLVVDDDPAVRRAMARTLSKQQVTLAENGVAATRELEWSQPDVIVSDLRMPEMDGLALAKEVRRRWPDLADRIVFVSGQGPQIERAELEAPSQPVLRKPIDNASLESRIADVLEKAMLARKRP